MVRIILFLGHFHREDIRNRLVILLSTLVKNMNILCGPSVLLLWAVNGRSTGVRRFLARSEKAKQWGGIYHIKCSCFWEVLIKVLPIDSLCLPDENGPKNDIIRTIIKDITWEIFLKSSKPVLLKIVRFQLFSVQLIGRTPGIHWCHFHIDTMKNKQIQIL